ncbi:MAG: adenylosuccinate lyase [Alphaproteobacteria bacterium]|nr:adenylosuccinate lyase [Alphaproteobacteria bacterium]
MIPRYSRPQMAKIWEPENYFRIQLEIEACACEAQEDLGVIPRGVAKALREKGKFDVARIREIEREVHHETIAFLTNLAEHVGPESRFVHQGLTSSDVLDTCLAVQLTQAGDILLADLDALLAALKRRALEHKLTPTIARSHGVHAEPTTFGLKLAGHYAEFARNRERLAAARREVATCQISGAVGTFANIDPRVEEHVAKQLGLAPEPVSTQIIPRDRHAAFFMVLALIAAAIERFATELRHLQRTELREASEFFAEGQKGSSAMPHKKNPVLSENLTGLSRVIRAAVTPALENVVTWHERDISHSSVERFIAPDTTITLDFALSRLTGVVDKMIVNPARMQANLDALGGLPDSQRFLLALTQAGMSREDAYRAVQRNVMAGWGREGRFSDLLKADPEIARYLDAFTIDGLFDLSYHLKHVDTIFARVFGSDCQQA